MGRKRKINIKRKTPILKISLTVGKPNDYNRICEVPEFKDLIMHETLFAIKDGVINKKQSILLFEIADSKQCININRENWKLSLNTIMDYFSKRENYNKAIECRELIKQI